MLVRSKGRVGTHPSNIIESQVLLLRRFSHVRQKIENMQLKNIP